MSTLDSTSVPISTIRLPRSVAWMLLVACAMGIALTGLVGTVVILARADAGQTLIPVAFWEALLATALLTTVSLLVRGVRWAFLLRRSGARIPIRDADIGYFVGLSLLFVPLLVGELAVRAFVQRARAGVPIATTCLVNLWERLLDVCALAAIAAVAAMVVAPTRWAFPASALVALSFIQPLRSLVLRMVVAAANGLARIVGHEPLERGGVSHLASGGAWAASLAVSIGAWLLPGLGFWWLAGAWTHAVTPSQAQLAYAGSALRGGLELAPGGVLVVGGSLLADLQAHGFSSGEAAMTVLGVRIATSGLASALGCLFVLVHFRSGQREATLHFDAIARAYDVQIPEPRRLALLTTKTELMRAVLEQRGAGRRGLDVGCGQGWYLARMRALGFDVEGVDESSAQVEAARGHMADLGGIRCGSILQIPAPDASYDFVYCINVLHHLASAAEQRVAFADIERVLRPGGVLFVHEINTRNLLFRFYMGYVFPTINCIDEGVERWLVPNRIQDYTSMPLQEVDYFTFLPEFLPQSLLRLFRSGERALEASPLRVYAAHYMAVFQKPA